MVLYDDKKWLCRLIRTAFTIEDDTGICEKVLKQRPHLECQEDADSDSATSDDSFEIREGADGGYRGRSNTAIRLEHLEKQRKAQTETQNIHLDVCDTTKKDLINFVPDTSFKDRISRRSEKVIPIEKLLESVPHPDKVPFTAYARFDGSCQPTAASKRISIFLTYLPPKNIAYPLRVEIIATAKVIDLIGLSLWQSSQSYPDIALHSVHEYKLQISDEDGEWDNDFPPLDYNEPISKFSFSHLALVCCEDSSSDYKQIIQFSFLLPNNKKFTMNLEDPDVTVGQLISLLLTKSGWGKTSEIGASLTSYHFEKLGDTSISFTDMEMHINLCKCTEFCLVRDGAKSIQCVPVKTGWSDGNPPSPTDCLGGRAYLYPVMVSYGRFSKMRNALCVIWSKDRMDLEFQTKTKTKTYPLSWITGVKLDSSKNRVVVSITEVPSTGASNHYLSPTNHLTLTTSELGLATELYQRLNSIVLYK